MCTCVCACVSVAMGVCMMCVYVSVNWDMEACVCGDSCKLVEVIFIRALRHVCPM